MDKLMYRLPTRALLWACCCLAGTTEVHGAWPAPIEAALAKAGSNRAELERVLDHYQAQGDPQKLEAAQWLIAEMEGHGFVQAAFITRDKKEVPFDALQFPDFATALAALDRLEKEHGTLDYGRQRMDADLEHVSAELLIDNIDQAFQAWRELPWAQSLSYETFRDYVLPYRGSEEPAESFRSFMRQRHKDLASRMKDKQDPREAAALIRADVDQLIGFNELYYLHPTDQGLQQMLQAKRGRCEDITNLVMYAWRANGIAAAGDYTPAWADRDNNHAWEVVLDAQGRGSAGLGSRAAKIYRKMFARQATALGGQLRAGEKAPRWLAGSSYADVTEQYQPVSNVTLELQRSPPENARFAYLCVFNGGEWTPIHYGPWSDGQRVTFTKMGRNIAYLPAYFADDKVQPAGPPFLLQPDGTVVPLDGSGPGSVSVALTLTNPEVRDADTKQTKPHVQVRAGVEYEMWSWDPDTLGWTSHGKKVATEQPISFDALPAGRLYWLTGADGRKLERIFTVRDGSQQWY